jgi:hypothetical protein
MKGIIFIALLLLTAFIAQSQQTIPTDNRLRTRIDTVVQNADKLFEGLF